MSTMILCIYSQGSMLLLLCCSGGTGGSVWISHLLAQYYFRIVIIVTIRRQLKSSHLCSCTPIRSMQGYIDAAVRYINFVDSAFPDYIFFNLFFVLFFCSSNDPLYYITQLDIL